MNTVNNILKSRDCVELDDMIKIIQDNGIEIEDNLYYDYLNINNIIDCDGLATDEYLQEGYFLIKKIVLSSYNSSVTEDAYTLVTPKGQSWLIGRFKKCMDKYKKGNNDSEEISCIKINEFRRLLIDLDICIPYPQFCEYLVKNHIFESEYVPAKDYIDNGFFIIAETIDVDDNGKLFFDNLPLITPKGQLNLIMRLKEYSDGLKQQ